MTSKRKRVVLSITTKHEIIQKLENGESAAKLAKIYGIGKATITGIKSQKYAIKNYLLNAESSDISTNRKSLMVPKNKNVDAAVFQWFLQNRNKGLQISGPMLCEKALEFNEKLKENPNFKASSGWLEKFKSRHGIREFEGKFSIDNSAGKNFIVDFNRFLKEEGYTLKNVYRANKVEVMENTLSQETSNCKSNQDHIIALLCANATGCHKFPVLISGKDKNLHYFKNHNTDSISIVCKNQDDWNQETFSDWFQTAFVPTIRERQLKGHREKTLLIIDDVKLHYTCDILNGKDEFIRVMFFPPNLSLLIQPMDQGLIECFQKLCRENSHQKFLLISNNKDSDETSSSTECCYVGNAWSSITDVMLKETWKKLSCHDVKEIIKQETVSENADETIVTLCETTECKKSNTAVVKEELQLNEYNNSNIYLVKNDIIDNILTYNVDITEKYNENDKSTPSHFEAFIALRKGIRWLEAQEESNCTQLTVLKNLCNLAAKKMWKP